MRGERIRTAFRRLRSFERTELREFRIWIENTRNLVHLSVVLFVPLLIALVTAISNAVPTFSFLLFPPLASGTYTLFANPSGRYSSARQFIAGLTAGALCGWSAYWVGVLLGDIGMGVDVVGAALSVFLTGAVTWALDIEEPAAFSSALLVLVADIPADTPTPLGLSGRSIYVLSIAVSSTIIAGAFLLWRREFYEERARYLYQSTNGDDHVLVPMRGPDPDETTMLSARLAAAHDAGKVVLLDLVDDATVAGAEESAADDEQSPVAERTSVSSDGGARVERGGGDATDGTDGTDAADGTDATDAQRAAAMVADDLESRAATVRREVDVPCEVVVAEEGESPARTVIQTAHETNCDLIAAAYETDGDRLSPYLRDLFDGDVDVIVHQSSHGRTEWNRILVPIGSPGDTAHEMVDFATRLAGPEGRVAVSHCIDRESQRRDAEVMLANVVETVDAGCETRVSRLDVADFLESNAPSYDLVIVGTSEARVTTSRFVSQPLFERVRGLDSDVVVLDRNPRP